MGITERVRKPRNHKARKVIFNKEPKLFESSKQTICIKSNKTSQFGISCLKDLYDLKKPNIQMLQKKNNILPFEDITPIEKLVQKYESPMFLFTSHNKKRPHNLMIGRTYENALLDLVEFAIDKYKSLKDFKTEKVATGTKPMLVFLGELFDSDQNFIRIKNVLTDLFQGENVENIRLQGLEHVISFTAYNNSILFKSYRVSMKKSGTRIPKIQLEEIGPSINFILRRTKFASDATFKLACKKPKELQVRKKNNICNDGLHNKLGRIHVGTQKLRSIQTRKMKGLKRSKVVEERKTNLSLETQIKKKKLL